MRNFKNLIFYLLIIFIIIICLFPFYWIFITSLKTTNEALKITPTFFPQKIYLRNFILIFQQTPFARYVLNSFLVSLFTTILVTFICAISSYAIARLKWRGKYFILFFALLVGMFPQATIVYPLFKLLKFFHLINTYPGLILPYFTFTAPLALWILTITFQKIPQDLEDAAIVDGGSHWTVLKKIILPLSAPGLISSALLTFIWSWQEYFFARTFATQLGTVTIGIANLTQEIFQPNLLAAAAIITTIPLTLIILIFQKRIIEGLTEGAIKG